ncbi:alpha- and gamma-adaptin-binding protein p34 [Harpegnathos saltator]|uniref:Alpha-and gamma-adaptin-binding protein p34 n=1 Tax=Harpegnathos saltator TaxID=610380 RepID=E2C9F2_HARSA|nr:alpha- and gamma-adaptin-binding protein p34 [Harpegnathos saltator]EFN75430.1 Alpha- and gamma-adaptin-binding protein p34 [Harpegnathos saltator]
MNLPKLLIISTKEGKAREIAENIGAERLSEQNDTMDYLWNIDNKYYTSQISVCTIENLTVKPSMEGVIALILYHDPQADKVDQELEHLTSLITLSSSAEVLLFSCSAISDMLLRDKVLSWCVQNKFELVELDQTGDSESDTEGNKYGIERIIEALQAHTWPNIVLKDKPRVEETLEVNEIRELFENIRLTYDPSERLRMQDMLDGIMGEHADFGELFSRLMAMKEHAASLPTNEKRRVAEQIVTAFWRAIGGDLLEIEETPN